MFHKKFLSLFCLLFIAVQPIYAAKDLDRDQSRDNGKKQIKVSGLVHVQGIGDLPLRSHQWAGTKNENLSLEGFLLDLNTSRHFLNVKYMCHLHDIGDTGWVYQGRLCGTRGESRHMEGFAIRLEGKDARYYTVKYKCRLENGRHSETLEDGEFCGTRGQNLGLEEMKVWIEKR
jgi:hypothetical protein